MAKDPASSRVHRGDEPPDDAFVSAVKKTIRWTRENRRQVTIGGAALVIVALAATWYMTQQRSLEASATTRYNEVQQSIVSGNTQLAIRDLQAFLDTFGGTRVADQARLTLADILIREGRADEAIEALGRLPDNLGRPFGLAAARLEATALETMERYDEAIDVYRRIADRARFPFQQRYALEDAARIHLQTGQPGQAVPLLEQILGTLEEDTPDRGYYSMLLAEARAQAQASTAEQDAAAPTPQADTAG
ncbi:MAG: tetratricopeptide repeat protein [Gemmatimonadota bacterium]